MMLIFLVISVLCGTLMALGFCRVLWRDRHRLSAVVCAVFTLNLATMAIYLGVTNP